MPIFFSGLPRPQVFNANDWLWYSSNQKHWKKFRPNPSRHFLTLSFSLSDRQISLKCMLKLKIGGYTPSIIHHFSWFFMQIAMVIFFAWFYMMTISWFCMIFGLSHSWSCRWCSWSNLEPKKARVQLPYPYFGSYPWNFCKILTPEGDIEL